MRYFSMFSGIGGFELGIQNAFALRAEDAGQAYSKTHQPNDSSDLPQAGRLSATCVGYSEIDKYAIKVYERNFNGHRNYGDATTINPADIPDFDLLVGGFPCQAFSVAGKRLGFNETRGTLFFDIARILKVKRPRHLVLENVKGLLSHDGGKTFTTIIGVLSDLGYLVEWQVLNSKDFGVPQNRERVYIIGHLGGKCRRKVFPLQGNNGTDTGATPPQTANTITANYFKGPSADRPLIRENASEYDTNQQPGWTQTATGINQPSRGCEFRKDNVASTIRVAGGGAGTPKALIETRIRKLTPKECERLQGLPDDWTALGSELCDHPTSCPLYTRKMCSGHEVKMSDTQRYKMCGNAVTVNVVQSVMERLIAHL